MKCSNNHSKSPSKISNIVILRHNIGNNAYYIYIIKDKDIYREQETIKNITKWIYIFYTTENLEVKNVILDIKKLSTVN